MFAIGPVYTVYDHYMFPSTEDEKAEFEVTDENGKKVILPRPVAALRIWSTEKQIYETVDPTLDGVPELRGALLNVSGTGFVPQPQVLGVSVDGLCHRSMVRVGPVSGSLQHSREGADRSATTFGT